MPSSKKQVASDTTQPPVDPSECSYSLRPISSIRVVDEKRCELIEEESQGIFVLSKLGHLLQSIGHTSQPGITFLNTYSEGHVTRPHPRMPALHAVGRVSPGALNKKQRQVPLGLSQILRI